MPRERSIVAAIRRELGRRRVWNFKVHGSESSQAGIPDLICCVPCPDCQLGRFVALEAKVPGKILTPLQALTLDEIRAAGGLAAMVDSVDSARIVLNLAEERRVSTATENEIPIPITRIDAAVARFMGAQEIVSEDQVVAILAEIGLFAALTYNTSEALQVEMTGLQWIAAAAALEAYIETLPASEEEEDEVLG